MEFFQKFLGPWILKVLFKDPCQLLISSGRGKDDLKGLCHFVKIKIFIIKPALLGICPGRADPDHVRRDGDRTDKLHDGDTLVALLHVKAVHEFIDLDRIPDPFFDLRIIEPAPLCGKFCLNTHQGHEVGSKGILPPARPCADDHIHWYFSRSQADLGHTPDLADHLIQRRKVRVLPFYQPSPILALAEFFCFLIIQFQK